MKVLLVSPSFEDKHRASWDNPRDHYPLGLAYVHACLEDAGHKVETLMLNSVVPVECLRTVVARIKQTSPSILGIQMYSFNRVTGFRLIEAVSNFFPNVKIILGGIHATVMWEQLLTRYPNVIIVRGEGEETAVELLEAISEESDLHTVKGLAFSEGGTPVCTEERPLIADLDSLPQPEHGIFFGNKERTMGSVLTSRGCPFNCTFCVLDKLSRRKVRFRSPESVVSEIQQLIQSYPKLESIWIHDDAFFLDNKRAIEICELIKARGISLRFTCSGRFKPVSRELLVAMESAGFKHILFGLESGSEKILKGCRKGFTKDDVRETYRLLVETGIYVNTFLIVGLPGENDETIRETIDFVKELQHIYYTYYDDIGICMISPGTEVYKEAKAAGQINDDYWMGNGPVPYYTVDHSEEKLVELKELIRSYISLPRVGEVSCMEKQRDLLPKAIRFVFKFYVAELIQDIIIAMVKKKMLPEFFNASFEGKAETMLGRISEALQDHLKEKYSGQTQETQAAPESHLDCSLEARGCWQWRA